MSWPVHGVDQENILPSVIVIIEEANTAAHRLREILFPESTTVVFEVNARLGGDICEGNGTGGARRLLGRVGGMGLRFRR
jgi:hypothetical protein